MAASLLSNQLEGGKSLSLKDILERKGYIFYLGQICEEICNEPNKIIVKTTAGGKIYGDTVIFSAGTKIRLDLAVKAGLDTGKGIIVNKYLITSDPDIYAAGDCAQFSNRTWGFVKSSVEQGNIAAENMVLNNNKEYSGTHIDLSLKITGINLNNL